MVGNGPWSTGFQSLQSRHLVAVAVLLGVRRDHPAVPAGIQPHRRTPVVEHRHAVVGVDVLEVVHLEERLGGDLPVARHEHALAIDLAEVLAVEGREHLGCAADPVSQRCGVGVRVDEHEALEHLARDRRQAPLLPVEVHEVAFVGERHERAAVDLVGPGVVLAAQSSRRAALVAHDRRTAMLAGVVERADDPVGTAHDDHRVAQLGEGHVVAGLGHVLGACSDRPGSPEDVGHLQGVELVADVALLRNVGELREPLRRCIACELVVHLITYAFDQRSIHRMTPGAGWRLRLGPR